MNRWASLLLVLLVGCSALVEDGPPMQKLHGSLTFREETALPTTATAHVVVMPAMSGTDAKPVAQGDFPARTGRAILFDLKVPVARLNSGGEYLVFAQVVDHGKILYSNLTSPLRISFVAEPGDLTIELRREQF